MTPNYSGFKFFCMNENHNISNSIETDTAALIVRDFGLAPLQPIQSEQDMIDCLSKAIAYMIEHKLDFLFSLLYRLDISEAKINRVLVPNYPIPANIALAQLVWERQKQRIETKRNTPVQHTDNWLWDF